MLRELWFFQRKIMIYYYLSLSLLGGPLIVMPMPGVDRLNHALYDQTMVLILDGNLDMGAHVRSNLCYLTWLRHLIKSCSHKSGFFLPKRPFFSSFVRNID